MDESRKLTHWAFILGVVTKLATGLGELFAGFLLFSTSAVSRFVIALAKHELGEDPRDFIANKVIEYLPYLSTSTQFFATWYFLIHGTLNLLLAVNLLRKRLWAYKAAIIVHIAFVIYELYRFSHTRSIFLISLALFDTLLIVLIWREYSYARSRPGN